MKVNKNARNQDYQEVFSVSFKKKGEAFSGKDWEKLRKEQITPSSAKHTMIIVVHKCSFRFDYVVQFMIIFIMCTWVPIVKF